MSTPILEERGLGAKEISHGDRHQLRRVLGLLQHTHEGVEMERARVKHLAVPLAQLAISQRPPHVF